MRRWLAVVFILLFACAAVIDRIAITVGQQVITEQQLDEEIRVTALLNRENISRTLDVRRSAADHLVQQLLVKKEIELSHYPPPGAEDLDKYFAEIRAGFGTEILFSEALVHYDVTEPILREHLALQLTTLKFIEFRFQADADITDSQIEASYERDIAPWKAAHPGGTPPTLASSRDSIRKALLEQRTDELLNGWLEETRRQVNVVYLDKSLQ